MRYRGNRLAWRVAHLVIAGVRHGGHGAPRAGGRFARSRIAVVSDQEVIGCVGRRLSDMAKLPPPVWTKTMQASKWRRFFL